MPTFTLPKTYDFKSVEGRRYEWWESQGFFKPKVDSDVKPYVISMPPPNVTGQLHLGHAMFIAMEDLMIRHSRMKAVPTLWLPGTDHAGIATQSKVERYLRETKGVGREEIGREEFIRHTWEWKEKYGGIITQQLRRLGASCDWERERFTLDEGLSRAVREAFVHLYEKGLIYRGSYLINWSPGLQTAVSDLEVEYKDEQATLYYFKYPLADSEESIPVATTRPETILGDTAVAVHPQDERYNRFIGHTCLVPMLDRAIPVIADSYVDREFGTGALKITPGHDQADYEIGKRHGLEIVNVLNTDATMNENAGPYDGMDRYDCRQRLWQDMEAAGMTLRTEPYLMQVPRSQRGGEVIEPMVSTQWFVKMKPLAEPALEVVRNGEIEIIPERFTKVYYNWMENIRDWCISRQLWWGHRIPAWHCDACGKITVAREDPTSCENCGSPKIQQDPDVLDTWFSSGLWPFSTLGWPEETEDLATFYPTTMMETGYDILFFWVARMIMMGLEFTGQVPFYQIYLHGLFRDEQGRKMSKSLGNAIDPLELMAEYGADALRFTLLTGSSPGNDIFLSLQKLEANRNFANKLWNASRLVIGAINDAPPAPDPSPEATLPDRWIRARLNQVLEDVNRLFANHQYGEAGRQLYDFFWSEYADWYLEIAKLQIEESEERAWLTVKIMVEVLDKCLRMLHPFMPFVTEELWAHLKESCLENSDGLGPEGGWEQALIVAHWPEEDVETEEQREDIREFSVVMDLVRAIRNERSEKGVEHNRRIAAIIHAGDQAKTFEALKIAISSLARLDPEKVVVKRERTEPPADAVPLVLGPIEAYLPLAEMVDMEAEVERLQKELQAVETQIARLRELLAGPFSSRAPEDVVNKERQKLADFEETATKLHGQLDSLK